MKKKALILHCWYGDPKSYWYPWLKSELTQKDYDVLIPELPTMKTDLPDMELQLKTVKDLHWVDKGTVVVGHSLGCLLALRMAERYKVGKLILVSGWDFNDLSSEHRLFWKDPIGHQLIKKNVKQIVCVTSDNDPYFTAFQVGEMNKRLGGKLIVVKGAGHFTDKYSITKISQILEEF